MAKHAIVWDLDNTLYRETPQFHDRMDQITAEAAIEDFHLPLDLDTAKAIVTESYRTYRDGGELFCQRYGIDPMELSKSYHKRKQEHLDLITPYENLPEKLSTFICPQYIFSTSSRNACAAILKHIGLYDLFAKNFYSVEDFDCYKKNESSDVYLKFCEKAKLTPQDCIFVDDSYSNLEFAKKAGMTTVRLCHGKPNDKCTEFIDYACDNIDDCLELLQKIC